jgi:redox-sensing transcriptional repressor
MDYVPEQTVNRLPIYLRCLNQARAVGTAVVNSVQLAQMAGTNAAQVRKDLSYLGELGTRGVGYDVEALLSHITDVLGLKDRRRVAIVGYGRLGGALHGYRGLADRGFDIVAVFDDDAAKVGSGAGDLTVLPVATLERDLRDLGVEIVILTTPTFVAQQMAERVAAAGVRAIMNFTYARLELREDVKVRPVDLSVGLQVLSFYLARIS